MSRSAAALDGRAHWSVTLAAVVLLVLPGGLAYKALRPAPQAALPPAGAVSGTVGSRAANALIATSQAPTPEARKALPVAAAIQPKDGASLQPADMPYRFLGKAVSGTETSIVLFGRGRIVTLSGAAPVDDEYVVDAVFDEYLVLRHVPTGAGRFLEFARRQHVVEPARDPEQTPRD